MATFTTCVLCHCTLLGWAWLAACVCVCVRLLFFHLICMSYFHIIYAFNALVVYLLLHRERSAKRERE